MTKSLAVLKKENTNLIGSGHKNHRGWKEMSSPGRLFHNYLLEGFPHTPWESILLLDMGRGRTLSSPVSSEH